MKKFRRLAFEGVANKLEDPSQEKQRQRVHPQAVIEDAGDKQGNRQQDGRYTQSVTRAIYRMLMTGAILRDPLLIGASAKHAEDNITISTQ